MEDAVRPSAQAYMAMYERGYRTWSRLHDMAAADPDLHWACLHRLDSAFPHHPRFPPDVAVHAPVPDVLIAKGTSTWAAARAPCDLKPLDHELMLQVSACRPTEAITSGEVGPAFPEWFGEGQHVTVLFLAWAYLLSARWAELISQASSPEYTECEANWAPGDRCDEKLDDGPITVYLGDVDDDAARWWAAVLASGSGWTARVQLDDGPSLYSPWCLKVSHTQRLELSRSSGSQHFRHKSGAPSYAVAKTYLESYCAFHGVTDQSRAALSAALLISVAAYDGRSIELPLIRFHNDKRPSERPVNGTPEMDVIDAQLDKLLTMSCNARGVKALFNSVFFEPDVPCNRCSAWVQGTFGFLDADVTRDSHRLARVLMKRDTDLGFLWIGAFIVGVHKSCFNEVMSGRWKVDLHAAAWTGTHVSFIQDYVQRQPVEQDEVSRADECRLRYLTRSTDPLSLAFVPFGSTALSDTDLQVKHHVRCDAVHGLEYRGFTWHCRSRKREANVGDMGQISLRAKNGAITAHHHSAVVYNGLDRDDEACSIAATRGVFSWLREEDGFPAAERSIREHAWVYEPDNEDLGPCPDSPGRSTVEPDLHGWLGETLT